MGGIALFLWTRSGVSRNFPMSIAITSSERAKRVNLRRAMRTAESLCRLVDRHNSHRLGRYDIRIGGDLAKRACGRGAHGRNARLFYAVDRFWARPPRCGPSGKGAGSSRAAARVMFQILMSEVGSTY